MALTDIVENINKGLTAAEKLLSGPIEAAEKDKKSLIEQASKLEPSVN